jgi:hypothetical protein
MFDDDASTRRAFTAMTDPAVGPTRTTADLCIPTDTPPALDALIPEEVRDSRSRRRRAEYLAELDPELHCQEIGYLLGSYEFPWDTKRALELALLRTFGIAKGTPLLVATGELVRRTQKRYDDTALLLAEVLENGFDHPRGRAALRRINQLHHRHPIPNDESLYTLSTFIFEPIRWNARFGWRPLSENERLACYHLWCRIGRRMGIRHIPETYAAFEQFNIDYEAAHFRYSDDNHRLAVATRNLMLGWYLPRPLWPIAAPVIHALPDEPMLAAVGLRPAPPWLRGLVTLGMRLRARVLHLMPPRRRPWLITRRPNRSYPNGYRIDRLGADQGAPGAASNET